MTTANAGPTCPCRASSGTQQIIHSAEVWVTLVKPLISLHCRTILEQTSLWTLAITLRITLDWATFAATEPPSLLLHKRAFLTTPAHQSWTDMYACRCKDVDRRVNGVSGRVGIHFEALEGADESWPSKSFRLGVAAACATLRHYCLRGCAMELTVLLSDLVPVHRCRGRMILFA